MRSIGKILSSTRALWLSYLAIVVSSVLITATSLVMPFIISGATDEVVSVVKTGANPSGHVATIMWFAVALLVADLANTAISNIGGYIGDVTAVRLRRILSTRYFEKLLTLPQSYFDRELTGRIINRLSRNISETTQFLNSFANNFLPMLLTTFAVLVISAIYSWPLALLLLIVFPVFMYLTTLTSKKWQVLEGEKNSQFDIAGGRFAEVVGQIRVVKSFGQERRELTSFDERYASTVATTREQSRYWHLMDGARRGALNVIFFGVYSIIFVQTVEGHFSIGDMVLLIQLVNMARQPVMMMSYLIDSGQRAVAGSRDYFRVLDERPEREGLDLLSAADTAPGATIDAARARAAACTGSVIEFDHASFGYDADRDVLKDITLAVERGERVAFVGESGGGKTTLISLLLGLYTVHDGHLRVFGRDTAEIAGIPVEAVPAYNTTPDRLQYHPQGRDNGYVFSAPEGRIYVAGDTEDTPEFRAQTGISLALVPMNLPYTMTAAQATSGVAEMNPRRVIPYHHRGTDPAAFAEKLKAAGAATEVIVIDWYPGNDDPTGKKPD